MKRPPFLTSVTLTILLRERELFALGGPWRIGMELLSPKNVHSRQKEDAGPELHAQLGLRSG